MGFFNTRRKGAKSEQLAIDYIKSLKYKLIAQNYTYRTGEIDIIAIDDKGFYVFIEVKSLSNSKFFYIYDTLTRKKLKNLKSIINYWLYTNNKQDVVWRVDFIGITYDNNKYKVEHFKFIGLEI